MKGTLSEEALIAEIEPFVKKMYKKYGKGLVKEDLLSEIWCALFEAFYQYPAVEGTCTFEVFAELFVLNDINEFRRNRSHKISLQSKWPLNGTPDGSSETDWVMKLPSARVPDFSQSILFWDYLRGLGDLKYKVSKSLAEEYTDYEIIDMLQLTPETLTSIKQELTDDLTHYIQI